MANRWLFDGPDPKPKGMGVRGLKPRKDGSQESPLKWAGSKAKPHYLDPLHRIVASLGADTFYDPMFGGGNLSLNAGAKNVVGADRDRNLINAFNQIKNAKGGLEVDWSEFTGKGIDPSAVAGGKAREQVAMPGEISKPTFYGDDFTQGGADFSTYTGPTLRGSTKNPQEGSLNYMLDMANRGELDDDGYKRLAQLWLMTQQSSLQGFTRYNPQGRYSMTRGASGPYADIWNYRHYQPMMENFDLDAMPVDEFLRNKEIDTKRGVMGIDPPYEGEQAGYGDKFDMASGQQQQLARQLGELAEDGMPIIAYNSPLVADLYRDQGFSTMLNRRRDNTATVGDRGIKPELIATANIPNFDAAEYFRNHPQQQFLGTPEEAMAWEQRFGEAFNPDDWLGKAEFFPDGIDPQTIIRRSIVNDLTEMADILKRQLTDADKINWGKPGQMFWWEKRYGGKMPKAVPYPWNEGPARPEGQYWGGGGKDVYDMMDLHENRDLLNELLGPPRDRNIVPYPLEGKEIVPFEEYMTDDMSPTKKLKYAQEAAGGYGKPSKMEGISVLDMPALACKTKTCGACEACYARQNNMAGNAAQARQYRNLDNVLTDPTKVASALDESLLDSARVYARSKNEPAAVRYKSSGDGIDAGEFSMQTDVWNNQSPIERAMLSHWYATRQYPQLHEFLQARNWKPDLFPENVHMKVSLPGNETRDTIGSYKGPHADLIRDILSHPQISATSLINPKDVEMFGGNICAASHPDNPSECNEVIDPRTGIKGCNMCHSNQDIGYIQHGFTLDDMKQQRQGQEATKANFLNLTDPAYRQRVLGRRVV